MKLRSKQRVVSTGDEGQAPPSWPARFTTGLYYLILLGVVTYGAVFLGSRLLFFRAPGLVTISTTVLAPTREGRVAELPFEVGDTVWSGSLVARIEPGLACQQSDQARLSGLRTQVRLTRGRHVLVEEEITLKRDRLDMFRRQEPLELDLELRRERVRVEGELRKLENQRRLLVIERRSHEETLRETVTVVDDPRCLPDMVHSPLDGTVSAVYQAAFDVVNAGDPILSLRPLEAPVRIIAYMDPGILPSVFPQKRVRVRFPDGSEDDGVVRAVRAASESFAHLDVEDYRFQDSDVLAEILPADSSRARAWQRFDRLEVTVTGRRGRR